MRLIVNRSEWTCTEITVTRASTSQCHYYDMLSPWSIQKEDGRNHRQTQLAEAAGVFRTWVHSMGAKVNLNLGSGAAFTARPGTGWFDEQWMACLARQMGGTHRSRNLFASHCFCMAPLIKPSP